MTTSEGGRGDSDPLVEWFRTCFRETSQTARSLWNSRDLLDGGLTAGQASGNGVFVAFALKYEIGAGLLRDLDRFVEDHLTTEWIRRAPSLRLATEAITAVIEHLREHAGRLVRLQYGDRDPVVETMEAVSDAAGALQHVIDTCTAALAAVPDD